MADVSPSVVSTFSLEPNTRLFESLLSALAFDFDTEEWQCQSMTSEKVRTKSYLCTGTNRHNKENSFVFPS